MRDRVTNIWEMKKINEQEENQTDRNGCKKPKEKESHWFELSNEIPPCQLLDTDA